jgi:L,D-transpeptidase ErfK/SrfK
MVRKTLGGGLVLMALAVLPVAHAEKSAQKVVEKAVEKVAPAKAAGKAYDRDYVGGMQTYVAKYEDTMVQIARDFNVGFVELRSANPFLDPWIPGEGKKLIIPTMHLLPNAAREGVVINLSEMRMYSYMKAGQKPQTFPIGIGREGLLTPSGSTTIVRKKEGPIWRPTARMRKEHPELPVEVLPGPDNPMGTHALYLGWPEYAIHGTDKPFSIGRRVSSGCIRMYPEDISKAFSMFPVGTKVTVVDQPVKVGWVDDALYLEVHPTTSQADRMELDGGLPGYVFTEDDLGLIVATAGENARDLNWPLIRQVVRERRGYPVEIFKLGQKAAASLSRMEAESTDMVAPVDSSAEKQKKASAELSSSDINTVADSKPLVRTPN